MTSRVLLACLAYCIAGCGDDNGGGGGDAGQGEHDGSVVVEDCLGSSLLASLGRSKLMVGGTMVDSTVKATPIDVRYLYLSGGLFDGSAPCASCATACTAKAHTCANSHGEGGCAWWGCYQYDMDPPGAYVRDFIANAKKATPPYVPMLTYYEELQASGLKEGATQLAGLEDDALMTRYYGDWRFMLQQVGSDTAFLQIEPDLWGYGEQTGIDPHATKAAVASANATDCDGIENSMAGFGQCLIAMVRKYAPNAKVGLHASAWGPDMDALYNTDASFDLSGHAGQVAAFLKACGEDGADFVTIEASDRDAGYYASMGRNAYWDDTNMKLPDYTQAFAWAKALTEALGKPAVDWQLPLGNASQSDVTDHWKDNRVDYLFAHTQDVVRAHIVALAFGAGAGGQTTPESDGGNFVNKVRAYVASGGQAICP